MNYEKEISKTRERIIEEIKDVVGHSEFNASSLFYGINEDDQVEAEKLRLRSFWDHLQPISIKRKSQLDEGYITSIAQDHLKVFINSKKIIRINYSNIFSVEECSKVLDFAKKLKQKRIMNNVHHRVVFEGTQKEIDYLRNLVKNASMSCPTEKKNIVAAGLWSTDDVGADISDDEKRLVLEQVLTDPAVIEFINEYIDEIVS